LKIALKCVRVGGVPHIVGKILTRATTLLQISLHLRSAQKIMASKVRGIPILEISSSHVGSFEKKMTFGCSPRG